MSDLQLPIGYVAIPLPEYRELLSENHNYRTKFEAIKRLVERRKYPERDDIVTILGIEIAEEDA